jgi:putative IMPACT (imprinted ancient) family translation regulator
MVASGPFQVPVGRSTTELKVRGSRFIAMACPGGHGHRTNGRSGCGGVVTRYFGGTRLGTGGLARAYGAAAATALKNLPSCRVVRGRCLRVSFLYEDTGAVARALDALAVKRLGAAYDERAAVDITVSEADLPLLRRRLRDVTGGRIEVVDRGTDILVELDT